MIIRKQTSSDFEAVENLVRDSFWNLYEPGATQHFLVHKMRQSDDFIQELSLVAEMNSEIVAYIAYTLSTIIYDNGLKLPTITFGPICVQPQKQFMGIGSKILIASLEKAKQLGHKGVVILGYPWYYRKFGFVPSKKYNIRSEDGKFYLGMQILELFNGYFPQNQSGIYYGSQCFTFNVEQAIEYDQKFPKKEKHKTKSQQVFAKISHLQYCQLQQIQFDVKSSFDKQKLDEKTQ